MEITFYLVLNNVACSRVYCTPPRVSISGGHDSACSACQAPNTRQALRALFRSRVVIKDVCHIRATNLRWCCYEGGGGCGEVL